MSQPQSKQTNYLGIGAAVVILAIVLIAVITQATKPATVENTAVTDPTTIKNTAVPGTETATSTYEDGTYTVVGNYNSPAQPESIGVTVTLEDDVITAVSVEPMATIPASVAKQADFAANYQPMVIGKKIDELELGKVSGSSLTPKGFNDALEKIKAEAEVQA